MPEISSVVAQADVLSSAAARDWLPAARLVTTDPRNRQASPEAKPGDHQLALGIWATPVVSSVIFVNPCWSEGLRRCLVIVFVAT